MRVPDIHPPLAGETAVLAELELSQHALDIVARDFVVESLNTCVETIHRWHAFLDGATRRLDERGASACQAGLIRSEARRARLELRLRECEKRCHESSPTVKHSA